MNAELEYSDEFKATQTRIVVLMLLSACWISFGGVPFIPIGVFAAIHYVGSNYATTFGASLAKGWRIVVGSVAVAVVSWFVASLSVNIGGRNGGMSMGIAFEIGRYFN